MNVLIARFEVKGGGFKLAQANQNIIDCGMDNISKGSVREYFGVFWAVYKSSLTTDDKVLAAFKEVNESLVVQDQFVVPLSECDPNPPATEKKFALKCFVDNRLRIMGHYKK